MNRSPRKTHLCTLDSSGRALSLGCIVVASPPAPAVVRPCWGCSPRPMPIPPGVVGLAIARVLSAEAASAVAYHHVGGRWSENTRTTVGTPSQQQGFGLQMGTPPGPFCQGQAP